MDVDSVQRVATADATSAVSRASNPPGSVIVTFHVVRNSSTPSSKDIIFTCLPTYSISGIEDPNEYAHSIVAKIVASSDVYQQVLDPKATDFVRNISDLEFNHDVARALKYDFACWLTESGDRQNAPLVDNRIIITLSAVVVVDDGLLKQISLPPLRSSFAAKEEAVVLSGNHQDEIEDDDVLADTLVNSDTTEDDAAPFPVMWEKPSGRLPRYYTIDTDDGHSHSRWHTFRTYRERAE